MSQILKICDILLGLQRYKQANNCLEIYPVNRCRTFDSTNQNHILSNQIEYTFLKPLFFIPFPICIFLETTNL